MILFAQLPENVRSLPPAGGAQNRHLTIWSKPANGTASPSLVCDAGVETLPSDVSRDGKWLAITWGAAGASDVYVTPFTKPCKPTPLVATDRDELDAAFSPDGKWVAYTSDENGIHDIFLMNFPAAGGKWQVSSAGGAPGALER